MKQMVKAAYWTEERTVELGELQMDDPGPGEVQIAAQSVGICGSDLHFYRGAFLARTGIVPGHEFGGVITAVGKGVQHVQEGDMVGVEPLLRCGTCRYCVSGNYHACADRAIIGERSNGGMSKLTTVPAHTVYKTPTGVDAEVAALAEPLACSVHGFEKANLRSHETVFIIGAGSIGLTGLIAAKAAGAHTLIMARHPHQQEVAEAIGADEVIGDDDAGRARLEELSQQGAIDMAVETVGGHAETVLQAQRTVRPMGRVLVLGVFSVPTIQIEPMRTVIREVDIIGSLCYSAPNGRAEYEMALEMLADYGEKARLLVTHRFELDEVTTAFETALDKSTRSIKVHLNPNP